MSCPKHRSATNKNWCKMLMHMSEYCLCGPAGFGKDLMLDVVAAGLSLIICSACNLTSPIISGILFEILTGRQPISRSVLLPVDCRNFYPKCTCMQFNSALRVLDYVWKDCICAEKSKGCFLAAALVAVFWYVVPCCIGEKCQAKQVSWVHSADFFSPSLDQFSTNFVLLMLPRAAV